MKVVIHDAEGIACYSNTNTDRTMLKASLFTVNDKQSAPMLKASNVYRTMCDKVHDAEGIACYSECQTVPTDAEGIACLQIKVCNKHRLSQSA